MVIPKDAFLWKCTIKNLADWMIDVSSRFDEYVNGETVQNNKDNHNDENVVG